MRNLIIFLLSVAYISNVLAFQCARDHSDESVFSASKAVYLIRVHSVELYKDNVSEEPTSLLLTKFTVNETLKGKPVKSGEVTDLSGMGTGYVGFIPGAYYIIGVRDFSLEGKVPHITFCGVLGSAFQLDEEALQEKIIELRELGEHS